MKHEHEVTIKVPEEAVRVSEEYQRAKKHVQENKKSYLYAGLGLAVGFAMGRRKPSETNVVVVVNELKRPNPFLGE